MHVNSAGELECLSLTWRSLSFSVGHPIWWYLQEDTEHFQGRECVFSCFLLRGLGSVSNQVSRVTYVRSHGRLKTLSQSLHFLLMSIGGAFFFRRAIDRSAPSSTELMLSERLKAGVASLV